MVSKIYTLLLVVRYRYPMHRCTSMVWHPTVTRSLWIRMVRHTASMRVRGRTCGPDQRTFWQGARATSRCGPATRWMTRSSSPITSKIHGTCWPWWKAYGSCWHWWTPGLWASGTCNRTLRHIRDAHSTCTARTRTGRAWWSPIRNPRTTIPELARWDRLTIRRRWSIRSSGYLVWPT